ncbi:MAG: hypothetical protein M3548_14565 [Actinomycetota bacterium]|nr:hypothetical protein [Actinomycetota bacterium]
MEATIQVRGDDDVDVLVEFTALRDWLDGEPRLRGALSERRASIAPGEMGVVSDVLVAALGDGGAVTALAAAVGTWLGTRRSKVKVTITAADGRTVEVDVLSRDVERAVRGVLGDTDVAQAGAVTPDALPEADSTGTR